ncbi:MAG: hypothetical protein Q7T82_01460 [Armatimonadota bacterium]|nr:hypothetical protein [Armatimonadota bacterium]
MFGLLGKIVKIEKKEESGLSRFEVSFKAACTLPTRAAVPEWLKDQVLKIDREVVDPRELGNPGDSIVLTPSESARWLYPLTVAPQTAYGELPETLRIDLRWWKSDDPPEYAVRANGRQITGKFTKEDGEFLADIRTGDFYTSQPRLPVSFRITCDKMAAACSVLPDDGPFWTEILPPRGELHRLENEWYAVDVTAKMHAGGVVALFEKGRQVDHFRCPENLIQPTLKNGGHTDRLLRGWGWYDKLNEIAMTCHGARREGNATSLHLDGVVDDGQGIRTSVAYTAFDAFPLITLKREYHVHTLKKDEAKDKEKETAPKEPIDEAMPLKLVFRASWRVEDNGKSGSRALCLDGEKLAVIRTGQTQEIAFAGDWRMRQGWAIVEHPARREYTMYLFDDQAQPSLCVYHGPYGISLEPHWLPVVLKPGDSIGYTLGLTAGELCGASPAGAWVACRTRLSSGGVRCGVVARANAGEENVTFKVGTAERRMNLTKLLAPGLGEVCCAVADFPDATMEDHFDAVVAGIEARRGL